MAADSFARDLASAALAGASGSAKLNGDNVFTGDQTINGDVIVNGKIIENNISTELPQGPLEVNMEYYLGILASLSLTLPTGELGQYILISFKSGATPTDLSILTNNWVGDVPTPISNKTYEMICTWNGEAWVFSYRGY